MSTFIYTAKTEPGKAIQGQIDAESREEAIQKLVLRGYFPISLETSESISETLKRTRSHRIQRKDIVVFTTQLSHLVSSGINIIRGLQIIVNQVSHVRFKTCLKDIIQRIKDGSSLSEGLAQYPNVFSGLYVAMVHSGEVGGNIDESLKRLAEFLEKEEDFKSSLRSAMIYPLFLLLLSMATVFVLMTFVIPKLSVMFEDMGQALPLPTKMLLAAADFMGRFWWLLLASGFILFFMAKRFLSADRGRVWKDTLMLKLPVGKELVLKTQISRLFHTLALLLSNGVPILSALDVSLSVVTNQILKTEVEKIRNQVKEGAGFSKSLSASKFLPEFVAQIMTVGEESGSLEKSLGRIADEYQKEMDRFLAVLPRILEPVIILIMGLVVGFIVLAILLPIFQINLIVK